MRANLKYGNFRAALLLSFPLSPPRDTLIQFEHFKSVLLYNAFSVACPVNREFFMIFFL